MSTFRRSTSVHVDSMSVRREGNSKSLLSKAAAAVLGVLLGAVLTYASLYVDLGGFQITAESQAYLLPRGVSSVNGSATVMPADSYRSLGSNWSLTETPLDVAQRPCSAERKHFAFVKVHKAGSTTPYTVFQRFGRQRHLQFVLPSNERVDVGWPYLMKKEDYLQPIPGRPFDLLVDHTVYNREIFRNLLPNDTVYLAIVREPYSHLKSVVNWYAVARKYGLKKKDPVDDLLKHPGELDRKWLVPLEHKQPFSYTRNFMSFDLGLPIALADDEMYVRDYIAQLDRDFLLVMVLEYFDESLVLLKRYMCWQLTDILYKIQNSRDYGYKKDDLSPKMKKLHRNWSKADYLLYEHFNRTLWDKIAHEGEDFFNELARFKEINQMTTRFCDVTVVKNSTAVKRLGTTRWNKEFVINGKFCGVLNTRHLPRLKKMHVAELQKNGVNMPWPKWLGPPPPPDPPQKKPAEKKQPQPQSKPADKKQPQPQNKPAEKQQPQPQNKPAAPDKQQPQPQSKPADKQQPQPQNKPAAPDKQQPQPQSKPADKQQPQPQNKPAASADKKQPQPQSKPDKQQPKPQNKPADKKQPQPQNKPADKKQPKPQNKPTDKQQPQPPVKRTVTVKRVKSSKKRRH